MAFVAILLKTSHSIIVLECHSTFSTNPLSAPLFHIWSVITLKKKKKPIFSTTNSGQFVMVTLPNSWPWNQSFHPPSHATASTWSKRLYKIQPLLISRAAAPGSYHSNLLSAPATWIFFSPYLKSLHVMGSAYRFNAGSSLFLNSFITINSPCWPILTLYRNLNSSSTKSFLILQVNCFPFDRLSKMIRILSQVTSKGL